MHGWLSCDRWCSVQAMIVNCRRLRRVTDLIRLKSLQAIDMKLSIVNSSVTYSELHRPARLQWCVISSLSSASSDFSMSQSRVAIHRQRSASLGISRMTYTTNVILCSAELVHAGMWSIDRMPNSLISPRGVSPSGTEETRPPKFGLWTPWLSHQNGVVLNNQSVNTWFKTWDLRPWLSNLTCALS